MEREAVVFDEEEFGIPPRGLCGWVTMVGPCHKPASHHVVWDPDSGTAVCPEHKNLIETDYRGFLGIHEYRDGCWAVESVFDSGNNCCRLPEGVNQG